MSCSLLKTSSVLDFQLAATGRDHFCLTFLIYGTNLSLIRSRLVFSLAQSFSVTWNSRGNGNVGSQHFALRW